MLVWNHHVAILVHVRLGFTISSILLAACVTRSIPLLVVLGTVALGRMRSVATLDRTLSFSHRTIIPCFPDSLLGTWSNFGRYSLPYHTGLTLAQPAQHCPHDS